MAGDRADTAQASRRSVLAAAAALGTTSGCLKRTRNVLGHDAATQVELEILSVPSDSNPFPGKIARELATNLRACGVDAAVTPVSPEELHRRVLLNHDFDVYVGQFPRTDWVDPDQLYAFLHSVYASERGWQNPFGYTDLRVDEELETQRTASGSQRRNAVDAVQHAIAETLPFVPVTFPDALTAVRTDRFEAWHGHPGHPLTLLGAAAADGDTPDVLSLATTDPRITENRNPLAAEFRTNGTFIDLLYDPLGRRVLGGVNPWLASHWTFIEDDENPVAVVDVRDEAQWHDGEDVTASDVVFTYRFLADTSMGQSDSPIPASRYRGRTSLVDDVSVTSDGLVRIQFVPCSLIVAKRALTVPILPEHVWEARTDEATVAGVETNRNLTEALVTNNQQPVGSGPLQFERAVPDDSLRLSRFDDHFLPSTEGLPEWLAGAPAYEEVRLSVAGTDDSAVELVAAGDADATVASLGSSVVPRIGRESALELVSTPSRAFYHVGFNLRESPLSNTRFRRVVGRLLDKRDVVDRIFDGYAKPAASPLAESGWLATDLTWDGTDPATPFLGDAGDIDVSAARRAFVEAGYRYDDGELVEK